ncbi:hypothetical protein HOK31_10330, partial [Candidatus Poribacteria bacterium]|nr:hypothetical protein [Candidatus Poribacteria bacterium]
LDRANEGEASETPAEMLRVVAEGYVVFTDEEIVLIQSSVAEGALSVADAMNQLADLARAPTKILDETTHKVARAVGKARAAFRLSPPSSPPGDPNAPVHPMPSEGAVETSAPV